MTDYGGNVAKFLRQYRKKHGLSQRAMAKAMRVDRGCLAQWEASRNKVAGLSFVDRLSQTTGASIQEIIGLPDRPPKA